MADPPVRRLYRSRRERKIAGVCGGLAEYLEWVSEETTISIG